MGFGRGRRFDGLAGAEAPAPARLRAARPEVARRRSRRLGLLRVRQSSSGRLPECRRLGLYPPAGAIEATAVAPQIFVYCRQSFLPSRARPSVQLGRSEQTTEKIGGASSDGANRQYPGGFQRIGDSSLAGRTWLVAPSYNHFR